MKLTEQEAAHPVWHKIKQELEKMLKQAREQNDSMELTDSETRALRGKISCLKRILAFGEQGPDIEL